MSTSVITVETLSKSYLVGHKSVQQDTALRDVIAREVRNFARKTTDLVHGRQIVEGDEVEEFWALKNVSFQVKEGEVLGIIGRNGAGKSTLLKILSRITEPTAGEARLRGRVASLLEVGTGFHPELTGRENIFLNGAVLGMRRSDIKQKFDEIVAFAGVERFLDVPVKRYSSGMYVRLAFAVAAHLEPEILVVDEVLAVGDAEFQKKCLGKMDEVSRSEGRTVIFVSHNMAAVQNLCSRVMVMDEGSIVCDAPEPEAINYYLRICDAQDSEPLMQRVNRRGNGKIVLTSFHIEDREGNILSATQSGADVVLVLGYSAGANCASAKIDVGISIHANSGQALSVIYCSYGNGAFRGVTRTGTFRCLIRKLPFAAGRYRIGARVEVSGEEADWPEGGVGFLDVEPGDFYGTGSNGFGSTAPVLISGDWSVSSSGGESVERVA
jgi:lipopolysaccharide transport system ATP-binding protein